MDKKYQIFVSSTWEDLKEERAAVVKAILEMGHIPVGMEMFSAADEEQWQIIKSHIDRSDYYVVIVANRFGSITDGISYTEKEYDYALAEKIPVLGFVVSETARRSSEHDDPENLAALNAFKKKVKLKPISVWESTESLHGQVSVALIKQMTAHPQPGWIRGTSANSPEVVTELARLSNENAELRSLAEKTKAPDIAFEVIDARLDDARESGQGLYWNRMVISVIYSPRNERPCAFARGGMILRMKCGDQMQIGAASGCVPEGSRSYEDYFSVSGPGSVALHFSLAYNQNPETPSWILQSKGGRFECTLEPVGYPIGYVIKGNLVRDETGLGFAPF